MKKILITGSSGFIGKNLISYMKDRYEILCPGHKELDLLDGTAVKEYLEKEKFDIVIHSAVQGTLGLPPEYEQMVLRNNIRMFFHLEQCRHLYGKMFYFGSGAEYGKAAYIPMMKENYFGAVVPEDDYGLSKYLMSRAVPEDGNIYDLRIFGVFGPYEYYNYRFISNVICKALAGKDIVVHQNVRFDYMYIDDLCRIMEWFIEHEPLYRYYNVCRGQVEEIVKIAEFVLTETGSSSELIVEQAGMGKEYSGDNSRLLAEIGDFSFTTMEESIKKLIHFYKDNGFTLTGNY